MKCPSQRVTAAFVGTVLWQVTPVRADPTPLFRCPSGAQVVDRDGSITVDVPAMPPPDGMAVDLRLSPFLSKDHELGRIGFPAMDDERQPLRELRGVRVERDHLTIAMRAIDLAEGGIYSGTLRFVVDGQDVLACSIDVLMPKPARGELVSDRQTITYAVTKPLIGRDLPDASMSLRLFEKTRTLPIHGITAIQDGAAESPDGAFDIGRQLSFRVNGCPVPGFTQLRPQDVHDPHRTLLPGGQLNVQMDLSGLRAGRYSFGVRFAGVNAAGATPRIDVFVEARHHWLWAVLAIFLALVLSFVVRIGIVSWRARLRLRRRLQHMQDQSFGGTSELAIDVFRRTILAQTDDLLKKMWIFASPDSAGDYLAEAERAAQILGRYSDLMQKLDAAQYPNRVKEPYRQAITNALRRVGSGPLDQETTEKVLTELSSVETRLTDAAGAFAWYWTDLKRNARFLAQQVRELKDLECRTMLEPHVSDLDYPPKHPDDEPDAIFDRKIMKFDHMYWFIRLLYSRRDHVDDLKILIKKHEANPDLDVVGLFHESDKLLWRRLQTELEQHRIRIEPLEAEDGYQRLRPMKFILKIDDKGLADTYFVNNILSYQWQFTLRPDTSGSPVHHEPAAGSRNIRSLVTVLQPRVTTHAQCTGSFTVGVTICWESSEGVEHLVIPRISTPVGENAELKFFNKQRVSSAVHFAVMLAITLITGLPTLYFGNATFGSFADYVGILAWAIGIDQGKNLIQTIKTLSADEASETSAS